MRDFDLPPPEIEERAKLLDPDAWCSSDSIGGAYELRYRRYRAREAAGWPNDHHPPVARERKRHSSPRQVAGDKSRADQ
jgi:hypothetical protein